MAGGPHRLSAVGEVPAPDFVGIPVARKRNFKLRRHLTSLRGESQARAPPGSRAFKPPGPLRGVPVPELDVRDFLRWLPRLFGNGERPTVRREGETEARIE